MAQSFRNQCAALRIKANSGIAAHEVELKTAAEVDLTNNYLGGAGIQALTDIIKCNNNIHTLNLHSNGLSNESVVFLCRALRFHPSLKRIDLSGNALSLPAGLALLQFVHATTTIEEINLDGTLIDELLVKKIQRSININRGGRLAKAAPAVQATLSNINAEFVEKRQVRDKAKVIRAEVAEQVSGSTMREMAGKATLPPRDPESGWLILNVYASTTPGDFFSELQLLEECVIPKLNETFRPRKTHFVLASPYHGLNAKQRAALPTTCHADVLGALHKAPTIFLQFLGDKIGEFADVSEQTTLQEFERDNTPAASRGMRLFLVRQCAKLLKLPAAMLPLYSDDPQMAFPDATTSIVKNALLEARHITPPAAYNPRLAHERYSALDASKKEILEHAASFASMHYSGEFEQVDREGNVRLHKLDALCSGLIRRITAFIDLLLSSNTGSNNNNNNTVVVATVQTIQKAIGSRAAVLPGRKSLTGKLDLYCVTPPSRNSLLLTHEPGAGASILLAALNNRLEKRPGFIVASHFAREPVLYGSLSRDAKTMFLNLTQTLLNAHSQIIANEASSKEKESSSGGSVIPQQLQHVSTVIKSSVVDDLDVASARALFMQTLTDVANAALPKSTVVVILVDSVDCIEYPEMPCDTLRRHEATGADDWPSTDPVTAASAARKNAAASTGAKEDNNNNNNNNASSAAAAASGGSEQQHQQQQQPTKFSQQLDELEWIPTCLAKNVRFVLSCQNQSKVHQMLEIRGHDSCDVVQIPELGDADFEAIMSKQCELNGITSSSSASSSSKKVSATSAAAAASGGGGGGAENNTTTTTTTSTKSNNNNEPVLTEVDLATIRAKGNASFRNPQYLQFVHEALLSSHLTPQYMKRSTVLSTVPDNLDRCCDALLDRFEREFGLPIASLVSTSLACCARTGGMLDVHLRELIQRLRISRGQATSLNNNANNNNNNNNNNNTETPYINVNEFERILRILRPVLDTSSALVSSLYTTVGPLSASFHYVNIRSSHFIDCVRRRYLPTLDAAAAAHKHIAHFYLRHCAHSDPFQLQSIRAAAFHVVESGLWDTLEERLLTLPFLAMIMRRKQAAPVFNILVHAFNVLHPIVQNQLQQAQAEAAAASKKKKKLQQQQQQSQSPEGAVVDANAAASAAAGGGFTPAPPSSSSSSSSTTASMRKAPASSAKTSKSIVEEQNKMLMATSYVALLQLLREYIYFIRRNFRTLSGVPYLVAQVAILLPVDSALHIAAAELLAKRSIPRLVPVLGRTRNTNLHNALISGCQFTPSGLRVATGSHDGSLKVSNVMGEVVHSIRDGAARVMFVKYSQTSRYLVAACENHVILVVDAASGQTVSKIQGHSGTVKCLSMTARGRNVLAGYEDRELWVWDSETGRHVSTVPHHTIAPHASPFGGVNGIIPHPTDERIVYTICERRLIGSRILHAESENLPQSETLLNVVGHNALPLAAESCYVVSDGTFALLCAKDLVLQPPSFVRSEANVKVLSLTSGRLIAQLVIESSAASNRPGPVACVVSPDERWVVSGALDGTFRIYQPDWRTYSTMDDANLPEPTSVRPYRVLSGFEDKAPQIMKFSFDSKSFLATAGSVARIWPVQSAAVTNAAANAAAASSSSATSAAGGGVQKAPGVEEEDRDGLFDGFDKEAKIEFVAAGAQITCCDWSPNPSDDGAEIVIGDERGKLYCLREQV